MGIIARIGGMLAKRQTSPDPNDGNQRRFFPVKRGNILVTHDKALELAACFACVRVICEDIAKLPWNVFAAQGGRRRRLDDSSLSRLLNTRPNPEMGAFSFRELMLHWALTWGNGYAEIERDMAGRPKALWPLAPDRICAGRNRDNRTLEYEVINYYGEKSYLDPMDVFHVHGVGFDGITGYSMVGLAAQSLGFGLAVEEHGAAFYGNNTTIGLALKTDSSLTEDGYKRLKEEMDGKKGSANAFHGMILEQGLDFAHPNMSQVDAQYVETRRQIVEEIARWWRVPPHKIQELSRAHFANVENLNISYATDTLMPWVKRLEEEADWKLIGSRAQATHTKIAIKELMRGDSAARIAYYKGMWEMGTMSQNMILEEEDMNPIGPEGDEFFVPANFVPLKRALAEPEEPDEPLAEDMAQEAIESVAARLFSSEKKKARKALESRNRDEFLEWMDGQNHNVADRHYKAFMGIEQTLSAVFKRVSVERLVDVYVASERIELLKYYDGGDPDPSMIASALLEALE